MDFRIQYQHQDATFDPTALWQLMHHIWTAMWCDHTVQIDRRVRTEFTTDLDLIKLFLKAPDLRHSLHESKCEPDTEP